MSIPASRTGELVELCRTYLGGRMPSGWVRDGTSASPTFDPPLSPEDAATLAELERFVRSGMAGSLTPAEFLALDGDLATLRAFRQRTRVEFMALTEAQRWRALFDVTNAQTNVLRALLRD